MERLQGRVAVVTGAASGIGLALARALGAEGMKVVMADVEAPALAEAARALAAEGVETLPVETDVTNAAAVDALAARALDAFGAVHVVCNNAGVFAGGLTWTTPVADYQWVLGVNVWGVIHGIRTFVPILLQQDEGHVVNTASMAAVTAMPYAGAYHASKHAVLALSEVLYHELRGLGAHVGVSAVCPEAVATRIDQGERNRPAALQRSGADAAPSQDRELVDDAIRAAVALGIPPAVIAARAVRAIRENRFYVFAEDDGWRRASEARLEGLRTARNPTYVPPV
jgi:NAD(P)-dependent dehydrogenase (short-subunit alcohol dehydrogenase family)